LARSIRAPRLLILALAVLGGIACDGVTRLRRTVQDDTGRPVRGAIATLAALDRKGDVRRADSAVTQSNCFLELWLTQSPYRQRLVLRVEHSGYRPFERRFMADDTTAVPRPIVLQVLRGP
jgi:hypothetical protein